MESFPKNLSNQILTSFDYSSSEDSYETDDENKPILSNNNHGDEETKKIFNDQEKIDKNIIKSINNLTRIIYVVFITILLAVIFYLINVISGFTIPTFIIFVILWIGHLFVFGIIYKIVRRTLRNMINFSDKFNGGESLAISNNNELSSPKNLEKRMNMIVFILCQSLAITLFNIIIIIAEILILLNVYNLVPAYSPTIPLYIVIGFYLLYAFLFRSVSILETVSILLLFDGLLLHTLNLSTVYDIPWKIVFSPVLATVLIWLMVFFHIAVYHSISVYRLTVTQMECLFLYITGTIGFFSSLLLLLKYLEASDPNINLLKYTIADMLVSLFLFLAGLSIDISYNFKIYINRLGSSRPKTLKHIYNKGWIVDSDKSFRKFRVLGEINMYKADAEDRWEINNLKNRGLITYFVNQISYYCEYALSSFAFCGYSDSKSNTHSSDINNINSTTTNTYKASSSPLNNKISATTTPREIFL